MIEEASRNWQECEVAMANKPALLTLVFLSFNICIYSKAKCHHADFVHKSTMFNEDGLRTMVNERQARELHMAWQREEGN